MLTIIDQRLPDDPERVVICDPQPHIPVFDSGGGRIEEAEIVKTAPPDHGIAAASDEVVFDEFGPNHSLTEISSNSPGGIAQVIDVGKPAIDHRRMRIAVEYLQLLGQFGGVPQVVRIEKGNIFPARGGDAGVSGGRGALVGLGDEAKPWVRDVGGKPRFGVVRAAIIDHDDLEVLVVLLKNALESFGKVFGRIVGGNDDGNSGHGKVPLVAVS